VAPPNLAMPDDIKEFVAAAGVKQVNKNIEIC